MITILMICPLVASSETNKDHEHREHDEHSEGTKHIHGSHLECPLPLKVEDIISCSLFFHPSSEKQKYQISVANKKIESENQIPNPSLTSRYVQGKNNGKNISELEANLSFVVELGGKRKSRREQAEANKKLEEVNHNYIKSEIKTQTILNLYRLRQVLVEKEVISKALGAFKKVIGKLRKLPRLSPEQEASLSLFEMAYEELLVKDSKLFEEERKIEHYFHVSTGHSLKEIRPYLPKLYVKWPEVDSIGQKKHSSPVIKKLVAHSQIALKELELQKSQAWPNLSIGPSFAIEKEGGTEKKMIGLNVQLPLPFFQVNGGGKSFARSRLTKSKKIIKLMRAEEDHERFEQVRIYQSSISILEKTMKKQVIEKKNKKIESLYLRGVVSSSVFLNSLKQVFSYLQSRNDREISAVKALWNIYNIDGTILEEKI